MSFEIRKRRKDNLQDTIKSTLNFGRSRGSDSSAVLHMEMQVGKEVNALSLLCLSKILCKVGFVYLR